jgi:hypothetical protein
MIDIIGIVVATIICCAAIYLVDRRPRYLIRVGDVEIGAHTLAELRELCREQREQNERNEKEMDEALELLEP